MESNASNRMRVQLPRWGHWVALMAVLVVMPNCATTRGVGQQVDDAWITSKVKSKLAADPKADAHEIDVDVNRGVVRLSGTVETEDERQEAVELAVQTRGVQRVINDIELGDPTLAEALEDKSIETRVKAKFMGDPEIYAFNVDVDANQGVVTLSGTVRDPEAKLEAQRLARNTEGVKEVRNRIDVEGEDQAHLDNLEGEWDEPLYDEYAQIYPRVTDEHPPVDPFLQQGATNEQALVGAARNPRQETGTVVQMDEHLIVINTGQCEKEFLIGSTANMPKQLKPGDEVTLILNDWRGDLVATQITVVDQTDADFMTFASPDRSGSLPQTASHQALIALAGLLLLSASAAVHLRRM